MKLFSRLLQTSHRLLQILAIIPLLVIPTLSHAEVDRDGRADAAHRVDFSQAELDQILAPIALYPDTVLSQVLIAATYPIEVVQADRWASNNSGVKGAEAVAKVEHKDWDPSVKALVAFPDILQRMSDDIDWTQKLGDAFLSDEVQVMDRVQNLRKKAYSSGNLNKVQHLKVERDNEAIIIEPAQERVVYVPVYDTRVIYGNWWWPDYPPVYWHHPASYAYASGFYWGPSIYIGPSFFFSSVLWRERHVVVIDRYRGSHPVFYTGRSIRNYHGATHWRHEPIHRRGVAYYNNDLRTRYGSPRESYRDARVYREERREQQTPRQRVYNDKNSVAPRIGVDRSQQLRERMNQRTDAQLSTPGVERDSHRAHDQTKAAAGSEREQERSGSNARSNRDGNQSNHSGFTRRTTNEQENRTRSQRESNNLGATGNTLTAPEPRAQPETTRIIDGGISRTRQLQSEDRSARQMPSERIEQRRDQPRRERSGADEQRQNRPSRAL